MAQALGLFESDDKARLLRAADLLFAVELDDTGRGGLGMLSTELKAFITDIGALGNVELFSSQFETKQSISRHSSRESGLRVLSRRGRRLGFQASFLQHGHEFKPSLPH